MKQLHPRAVWLFFISFFIRFLFLMIFAGWWIFIPLNAVLVRSNVSVNTAVLLNILFALAILLFFTVFSYVWARLSYRFYKYELREDGFRKEHGVIWKKYVTIPYDRIQNVDIYRGLIARILKLSDLHIQTAGMSSGGQRGRMTEGRLPGLSREEAEIMRDELIQRARQSKNQGL